MAMKGYSIFAKAPGLKPYNQMQFSVISKHSLQGRGIWLLCRVAADLIALVYSGGIDHSKKA